MHQRCRPVTLDNATQPLPILKISDLKRTIAPPSDGRGQIVVGDWHVAFRRQQLAGVTADIAGAAGNQNVQGSPNVRRLRDGH